MNDLYVFAPIPRPGLWIFSSSPQPPPGHITLAAVAMHRQRRPGRSTELALSEPTMRLSPAAILRDSLRYSLAWSLSSARTSSSSHGRCLSLSQCRRWAE